MDRNAYIRVWRDMDLDDIQKHLLVAGDPTGDCANCREIGIDIVKAKACPKCGAEFKYIGTRIRDSVPQARRLKQKRPDLTVIEYSDFKNAQARNDARKIFVFAAVLLLSPALVGFFGKGYNKATEKDEVIFISTESEKRIGASLDEQVLKDFKVTDDPLKQERAEKICEKIAGVCERQDLIYRVKVLKDERQDNYNAFAVPGGYVYIFEPLLDKLKTDDEVAAIIAHEIGHVAAKHSIQRLQASLGVNALMLLGVGMGTDSRTFARANYALNQLMMSYSREAEVEADKLSVRYIKKAGYNPAAVLDTLGMLKGLRKTGPVLSYSYYRSHPYLSERISRAKIEVNGKMDFDSYINLPKEGEDF